MTWTELAEIMRENSLRVHNVNSFYIDDVYSAWGNHNVPYSSVSVYLLSADRDHNLVTYNIMMYYGDRLLVNNSNRDQIFDDGIRVLQTVLDNLPYDVEYNYPVTYQTFEQQFGDNLAGVYAQVQIDCPFEQGECGLPLESE